MCAEDRLGSPSSSSPWPSCLDSKESHAFEAPARHKLLLRTVAILGFAGVSAGGGNAICSLPAGGPTSRSFRKLAAPGRLRSRAAWFGRLLRVPQSLIRSRRQRWSTLLAVAVQIPGWTAVAGVYLLALPWLGVVSPITCAATWTAWLYVIGTPCLAASALAIARQWTLTAVMALIAVLAVTSLRTIGTIEPTPSDQFHRYRTHLAALAADYHHGAIPGTVQLPWRMRWLSVDGAAHRQCTSIDGDPDREQCLLYLPVRQNWRAENGAGFGYFSEPPAPHTFIVTTAGDMGAPAYELGDGWWWIE